MTYYKPIRAIISGGGTGGHIFPAVSIGNELKDVNAESEILFVGAKGKMEMEKVPLSGFKIVGLPICGIQRQLSIENIINDLQIPFKVVGSFFKARKILRDFKPDIAIGVGGYASAPLLFAANSLGVPTLIQEQNGFAGLTNKLLGKKAGCICVAYEGMERFFPKDKIVLTGNPIRKDIKVFSPEEKEEGVRFYGLDPNKKHILIIGGSLGSRTLNNSVKRWIDEGMKGSEGADVFWQCGRYYKDGVDSFMGRHPEAVGVHYNDFIARMDLAYAAADVVISRSGASSVSEICACAKAAVLVPSPNVAEDHQTHNAMALVRKDAALIVKDAEAEERMMEEAMGLLEDEERRLALSVNAGKMAKRDAAREIVDEIYKLLGNVQ